uniref:Uncharacterized protein n=1 Tax=viral metagenome TaxID=1070528 RepID=A0A6C0LUF4_9ZZZZ
MTLIKHDFIVIKSCLIIHGVFNFILYQICKEISI